MKRSSNLFWGITLILVSAALLADQLGIINFANISTNIWVFVFAGAAVLFLLSYFLNGLKKWGWLFPAFISAALSLTIWMTTRQVEGTVLGTPILVAIALPFYIGYIINHKDWGLLIPAWILTINAAATLTSGWVAGRFISALFLFAAALPFLVVFLTNHARRWALIPMWILFVLGLVTLISGYMDGNLISALFLYSVALPFLGVYLLDCKRRWALIPAAIIAFFGIIPLLSFLIEGEVLSALLMFLMALPFFVVFFRWKDQWWAFLPAGIFSTLGIVAFLEMLVLGNQPEYEGILTGVLLLGLGLTFAFLWLQCNTRPTEWALYPAIGLLTAAVLAFILGKNFQSYWAVVLLAVGILLIVASLLPRKKQPPKTPADLD